MSRLFCDGYPDTPEGHARMRLSMVAAEIRGRMGRLEDDTRICLVIRMHQIDRDDLPEDLRSLYDEFVIYLGMVP